jgi:DNA-binding NarL/FixJ family response regulator
MDDPTVEGSRPTISVLVCDDVDAMRMLLALAVGMRDGLEVVGEARDGNEAVAEASRLQPDVILLDLSMPNRTGLDALPELREVAPAAQVVVLSGFVGASIATDVLALGAALFLEKGADPDTIVAAIEAVAADKASSPSRRTD